MRKSAFHFLHFTQCPALMLMSLIEVGVLRAAMPSANESLDCRKPCLHRWHCIKVTGLGTVGSQKSLT